MQRGLVQRGLRMTGGKACGGCLIVMGMKRGGPAHDKRLSCAGRSHGLRKRGAFRAQESEKASLSEN